MLNVSAVVLIFILTGLGSAQVKPAAGAAPANKEQELANMAQATINWEKSSTAGMKAEMVPFRKTVENGQNVVEYKIKVTGASKFKKYALVAWPITFPNPVTVMDGLVIDAKGAVGCPEHSNDSCSRNFDGVEILIKYAPARGEIYRNALISKDHNSKVFFSVVPDPIIHKEGACSLEVIRLQPAFELVLVRARGFQPSEPVAFHTQSFAEVHDVQARADEKGQFWAPFTPYVEGRTSGEATVSAKGGKCSTAVTFNWGAGK